MILLINLITFFYYLPFTFYMRIAKLFSLLSILFLFFGCVNSIKINRNCKYSLKKCIFQFLIYQKEINENETDVMLFLTNLSDSTNTDLFQNNTNITLKGGIYSFGILGAHNNNYLMFVDNDSDIMLVEQYNIEYILSLLESFFKRNTHNYNEKQKLEIINNVLKILSIRRLNETLETEQIEINLKN